MGGARGHFFLVELAREYEITTSYDRVIASNIIKHILTNERQEIVELMYVICTTLGVI